MWKYFLLVLAPWSAASGPLELTILHMNDHHSHIADDTVDIDISSLNLDASEVEVTYGGYPRMVNLLNERANGIQNVIKLHAGDAITGTLYFSLFYGSADAAVMRQACFDAFILGNHEFDDGDETLATFLSWLTDTNYHCANNLAVLAANVVPGESSPLVGMLGNHTIITVGSEKVGVIGLDVRQKTMVSSSPSHGTYLLDEATTARRCIAALKDLGVNKIVLMTHIGFDKDLLLAANLTGVDVIVGGDSHTLLGGDSMIVGNPASLYPTIVEDADGNSVCITQAWEYAHLLGELNVTFDADGNVESCFGSPIIPFDGTSFTAEDGANEGSPLNASDTAEVLEYLEGLGTFRAIEEDTATLAVLSNYSDQVDALKVVKIANVTEKLCLERFPGNGKSTICSVADSWQQGGAVCNVVARAFVYMAKTADFAIQNAGGCRTDVRARSFTYDDAYTLLPFTNTLVTLKMTGAEVATVLEDALSNVLDDDGSTGSYPYASGLRFDIDATKSVGSRVSNLEVNSRLNQSSWTTLEADTYYTVVTNSYTGAGKDGYSKFGNISADLITDTYIEYAQCFIDYAIEVGELTPPTSDEYSTQVYIDVDGCDHSVTTTDCESIYDDSDDGDDVVKRERIGVIIGFSFVACCCFGSFLAIIITSCMSKKYKDKFESDPYTSAEESDPSAEIGNPVL